MASILFQPWSIFLDMHNLKRECFSNHGLYFFKKVSKESFLNYLYQNRILEFVLQIILIFFVNQIKFLFKFLKDFFGNFTGFAGNIYIGNTLGAVSRFFCDCGWLINISQYDYGCFAQAEKKFYPIGESQRFYWKKFDYDERQGWALECANNSMELGLLKV